MADEGLEPAQYPGDADTWERLSGYSYLSAPERLEHIEIMRVFCATLLNDLSAPEVLTKLENSTGAASGLDADQLTTRLEQLTAWGNLLRSSRG